MIIKNEMPVDGLEPFIRNDCRVMAKRMKEDFAIETGRGWDYGKRGDWLVRVDGKIWHAIADGQFQSVYRPALEVERRAGEERRVATT
jgi:hypothetical protein